MKNVRVKVMRDCWYRSRYWFSIFEGKKELLRSIHWGYWKTAKGAARNAKAMAKRIGIKYDPEIIKQYGY